MGTLEGLNQANHFPRVVAFEPTQSSLFTAGKGGPHRVEGIGVGFYFPFLDASRAHHFVAIDQEKAFDMCIASSQAWDFLWCINRHECCG